jgi:hypothetical protein
MGNGRGQALLGRSETKLQHLAAFSGWGMATPVTGFTIHDNVMAFVIPLADLFQ